MDPIYTFSGPGVYNVCFSFYDPMTMCGDSVCQQITIGNSCYADFTSSVDSSGQAAFYCTTNSGATYFWEFGDGNNSTQEDPNHFYSSPGLYYVCVYVNDSNGNFCDSSCHTVNVPPFGNCTADFTWLDTLGYTYFISSTTAGAGANYYWSFGDGNYSTQQNPSNTYWNPGTYTACLTVYDSNMVFCDSACHTVTVQGSGGCNADFTWIDSLGYVFFVSSSDVGSSGYYFWDFGDGNYSNSMNPSHQYNSVGVYTVCLVVSDSAQNFCDSICHTFYVASVGVEEATSLQNSFSASPVPADESIGLYFTASKSGVANVSFYDAAGRIAYSENVVHTAGNVNKEINTNNMPQGIYLVKLEVNGFVAWKRIALTHQ